MSTQTHTVLRSAHELQRARAQLKLGNHREASRLYFDAATKAIDDTATRIGFQLTGWRLYADVCDLLKPWYPHKRTVGIYSSMSLLQTNAEENYDLGDVWMRELADDIHELFTMLEFAVSQSDN